MRLDSGSYVLCGLQFHIIIRENKFKVRRSKKLQIYSFLLSFFIEVFYLLPYCSCFISIFSLPSISSPSLTISHIFFPLISFPSPHSHLLPFPSLISPFLSFPSLSSPPLPSLSCHLLSYHVIFFPSFPLISFTSFPLISFPYHHSCFLPSHLLPFLPSHVISSHIISSPFIL